MTANQATSPSSEAAIRVEGLTKRFGTLTAVDHIALTVSPGEAFALVGPDAAGKTTTMRMLVGIMDPDEGRAEVLGFDTVRESEALKEHIGYMPQRFGLYDDLTVAENMAFYADIYRVPREERDQRMPELLGFSNLTPFQDRLARNLSGGMRQKLGLACALIHRPRLLFLDEPTFGVDPISRREFWEILYGLLGAGLTIFLSTAYMDEAERAHRVGLMHHGRLLVVDTPKAIKTSFQGELLEARASNLWTARAVLATNPLVRGSLAMGDRLMLAVDNAATAMGPIKAALEQAGLTDVAIEPAQPTLEELFVQIVRRQGRVMESQQKAIVVKNLSRHFGDFIAVDNISFEVNRGEIFGFLGPNGAGKSTTIRMLNGLLLPTSGEGRVGGFDIIRENAQIKNHIGYMSQRFSLYEDLTGEENLTFFGGVYGLDPDAPGGSHHRGADPGGTGGPPPRFDPHPAPGAEAAAGPGLGHPPRALHPVSG